MARTREENSEPPNQRVSRRKYPWAIVIVVVLFVTVPFLSWYGTWFGRPLSDAQLEKYLSDKEKPRNAQHALWQIAERIIKGDESVKRWYPAVVSMVNHPVPEVRATAAATMGQDNSYEAFHSALLTLLQDADAVVRHNAALQLVRFNDAAGRQELLAMLEPHALKAESNGAVDMIIEAEGVAVARNAPLARIKQSDGNAVEVRAPEDGRVASVLVSDGALVQAGDQLMVLSPGVEQVDSALVALALVGRVEDIPHIQRYTREIAGIPAHIRERAAAATDAIRKRVDGVSSR